jgi:hypothetical protein
VLFVVISSSFLSSPLYLGNIVKLNFAVAFGVMLSSFRLRVIKLALRGPLAEF